MKTLPLFLFYTTTISFEQVFGSLLPIPFSRSTTDLKRGWGKLIEILRGRLAASRIDSYDFTSVVGNERGKGRYVSGLRLVYSDADGNRTTRDLVVKYLSARNEPLLLSSLKSAVERGMNREVEFYRRLAAEIPFVMPECLVAEWIPALYRGILVLERIFPDSRVQDHVGCTPDQSATVLDNIARMHARFWNRLADGPSTRWLLDRHPLDCYWFLKYLSWRESACRSLWRALYRYFAAHPRTLTHGDCRPGNILWVKAGSVAMLDWQFVHGGIGTWDASYYLVMSHEVDIRRRKKTSCLADTIPDCRMPTRSSSPQASLIPNSSAGSMPRYSNWFWACTDGLPSFRTCSTGTATTREMSEAGRTGSPLPLKIWIPGYCPVGSA